MVTQVSGTRGRTFFPYIGAHIPDEIQVAIAESLAWHLATIREALMERFVSPSGGVEGNRPSTAAADVPVRIRLLSVPDVGLNVSFVGEPLSRPRHLAGGVVSLIIDLANFQSAPVTLHGLDMANVSSSRSAFFNQIFQAIQGELFGIALSLVRNFGVMGGASKVLGILSAGVAKLAGEQKGSTSGVPEGLLVVVDFNPGRAAAEDEEEVAATRRHARSLTSATAFWKALEHLEALSYAVFAVLLRNQWKVPKPRAWRARSKA